jgi:hypothetical protein
VLALDVRYQMDEIVFAGHITAERKSADLRRDSLCTSLIKRCARMAKSSAERPADSGSGARYNDDLRLLPSCKTPSNVWHANSPSSADLAHESGRRLTIDQ